MGACQKKRFIMYIDHLQFMKEEKSMTEIVYNIIKEENKEIPLQTIYNKIPDFKKMTPQDYVVTYYHPKFHHAVRAVLTNLCHKGTIIRIEKGIYKLK